MAERKDYVISVRVSTEAGERFEKAINKLEKEANQIPTSKYAKVVVSKSGIIEDLVKDFCDKILNE